MYIPIILGTAREGRESEKVARFMLEKALEFGLNSEIIDVRDYRLPATDNTKTSAVAIRLRDLVLRADGLVIVSPEYNHGYPGELKMMLDMLYEEYFGKPVGICGVSSGVFGGARMIEHLIATCVRFHMLPTGEVLYFPRVQDLFDESGAMKKETYHRRADKFLAVLAEYAEALRRGKDDQS
jgi:NAD(P)H-dependent FMN reductase